MGLGQLKSFLSKLPPSLSSTPSVYCLFSFLLCDATWKTSGSNTLSSAYGVKKWFSTGVILCPCASPLSRNIWQHLETFLIVKTGRCYWYLVGKGQRRCYTSHNAQNSPHLPPQRMNYLVPSVNVARLKNLATFSMIKNPCKESTMSFFKFQQ